MGRIKSLMIKKSAAQLQEEMSDVFSEDFDVNKRALGGNTMPSKSVRNKVAGQISRIIKQKRLEETKVRVVPDEKSEEIEED